jgi:peptidoglycan/xylan/chitin deacetylase (PgdA/CDA1 family)
VIEGVRAGRHGIVYAAPRRFLRREVALTFDDGPTEWTPQVLDVLAEHGALATFFVLGVSVAGREDVLRRAKSEGHELANHAFSHRELATLDDEEVRSELDRTSSLLAAVTGERPLYFRPPFADTDYRIAHLARDAGLVRTVLRSVDPEDWREVDPQSIATRVLRDVRRGSIVCLHDGLPPDSPPEASSRQATVEALRLIIPELVRRQFRLVTVRRLLSWP